MGYQVFAQPPQHLERVDYNARLLEGFNATYQNHQHNRRSNRRSTHSSAAQSINPQVGPAYPPAIPQPFLNLVIPPPIQDIVDFQHVENQQAAIQLQHLQRQQAEHERQLALQQQALYQQQEEYRR